MALRVVVAPFYRKHWYDTIVIVYYENHES